MSVDAETARRQIAAEAQQLMATLQKVHQKWPQAGHPEREAAEDQIYRKLYMLADMIKVQKWTDVKMRELYQIITNETLPVEKHVASLPVYPEPSQTFSVYPAHPKTHLFLETLVTKMNLLPAEKAQEVLSDHQRDGPKDLLQLLVDQCGRGAGLAHGADATCKDCKETVLRDVFFMTSEMVVTELRSRAAQIAQMVNEKNITADQAKDLGEMLVAKLDEVQKLVATANQKSRGKKWVELIEQLFRTMVNVMNEIMMQYYLTEKMQAVLAEQDPLPLML